MAIFPRIWEVLIGMFRSLLNHSLQAGPTRWRAYAVILSHQLIIDEFRMR